MEDNRLFSTLRQLSKREWRALEQFLRSPYFNRREDVLRLLLQLKIGLLSDSSMTAEALFERVYPDKPFADQQWRLVQSYLMRLVERFLVAEQISSDLVACKILAQQAYREHNLQPQVSRALRDGLKIQSKSPLRNGHWHRQAFQLYFEQFQGASSKTPSEDLNRQQLSDTLDIAYLIDKLRQSCLLLAHQGVYQSNYEIELLPAIMDYLPQHRFLEVPAIAVYYHCYHCLREPEQEEHFRLFKQHLLRHGPCFEAREIRDLYLMAINYCIRRINASEDHYFSQVLELYKEGLAQSYLLDKGKLSRFAFHNIAMAGLKTGDLDWVDYFIHHYRRYLERTYRESSYSYTLAHLEYSRSNHEVVLQLLQKSNYRDVLLNLAAKMLLLKTYFELKELDLLAAHLEAMRQFIRRKRIIGYHRNNYRHIINMTSRILYLNPFSNTDVEQLEQDIQTIEPLTERAWLLQQLKKKSID